MSEQAAQRVLNTTDLAIPLRESLDVGAKKIFSEIHALFAQSASVVQYKQMANQTLG